MNQKRREKLSSSGSILSSSISFLGSYQVCHSVCLALVTLLSFVGITLVGMPLVFFTKIAGYFWVAAAFLFALTLWFYLQKKCISRNILVLNGGMIIAGIPFEPLQRYAPLWWSIGGALILASILLFIRDKRLARN